MMLIRADEVGEEFRGTIVGVKHDGAMRWLLVFVLPAAAAP